MDDMVHLSPVVKVVRIDVDAVHLVPDGKVFHDCRVPFMEHGIRIVRSCRFRGQGTRKEDSQCQQDSDRLFQIRSD